MNRLLIAPLVRLLAAGASALALAGCETGYTNRIDVAASDSVASGDPSMDAQIVSALRAYATSTKLRCDDTSTLPVYCEGLPIHVFAFRTPTGARVCFGAMGAPFEREKFERRIESLAQALRDQPGLVVSADPMTVTMPPACSPRGPATPAALPK
jgi:hypothetical protein